ncbi:MAG: alanine racemase [Halocynthiibacter sp.]
MSTGNLTIDLGAVVSNWRALDQLSDATVETAAVVKADGYGLGADRVAMALAHAGARRFFVATAEEGAKVRQAVGPDLEINIFGGHMRGDTDMIHDLNLVPMLNSVQQLTRHFEALPGHAFGIQLDTGMNRLGMEFSEWTAVRDIALSQNPTLVMSHLACADDPTSPTNEKQLTTFKTMTEGVTAPLSLSATGGLLLGPDYHFDITRPGVGIYGAAPYKLGRATVHLSLPVIQIRDVMPEETVGYSDAFTATEPLKIATVSGGYADGLIRAIGDQAALYFDGIKCPVVGRVSMDLLTVDVTHLPTTPSMLDMICTEQTVDQIAEFADTIGYEILTSLGARYTRRYTMGV